MITRVILLLLFMMFSAAPAMAQDGMPPPLEIPETTITEEAAPPTERPQLPRKQLLPEKQRADNDPPVSTLPPEEIPEEYLAEMEEVYQSCAENSFHATFIDCKCYAMKFLDKRIEQGPERPRSHLLFELEGTCSNPPEIAGYIYKECTESLMLYYTDYEEICTCAANKIATTMSKGVQITSIMLISLRRDSYLSCGLSEAARREINKQNGNPYSPNARPGFSSK